MKRCQEQFNFTLSSAALERRRTKFMHKFCYIRSENRFSKAGHRQTGSVRQWKRWEDGSREKGKERESGVREKGRAREGTDPPDCTAGHAYTAPVRPTLHQSGAGNEIRGCFALCTSGRQLTRVTQYLLLRIRSLSIAGSPSVDGAAGFWTRDPICCTRFRRY